MLPKLSQPTFTLTMPSTGKQIRYRSFTVKEEKLLFVAKSSGDKSDYVNAFKQLINNCCIDELDVDKLSAFDIEYFFLCLRAKSVSNVVKLKLTDDHGKEVEAEADLDKAGVFMGTVSNKIVLDAGKDIGIKMRYPTFSDLERLAKRDDLETELTLEEGLDLMVSMIDLIWEGENVYLASETPRDELIAFIDDFNTEQTKQLSQFMSEMPYVYVDITYIDSKGEPKSRRVSGIENFFV